MLSAAVDLASGAGGGGAGGAAAVGGVLLRGVLLGLGAAVPIGPVNVEMARRALRGGFFAGFALGCGAVTVDVFYLVLSGLSVTHLLNRPRVLDWLAAAGVLLLTYLRVMSLRAALRHLKSDALAAAAGEAPAAPVAARSAYLTGVLMTLLNPMTLLFWFTVVPAQSHAAAPASPSDAVHVAPSSAPFNRSQVPPQGGIPQDPAAQVPIMGLGVFIGTTGWVVTFSGLLGWAGRYRRNWWMAVADGAGGLTLLGFALLAFLRLIEPSL